MLIKKLTRYQFLDQLLHERQAHPPTPELEQEMQILREMLDELENVIRFRGRKRKFVGSINNILFEKSFPTEIEFGTEEFSHIFHVNGANSELMEFLREGYDIERHRRYDKDIDTTLVATVQYQHVQKIAWRVPWDETESKWFITDDDSFQCCKVVWIGTCFLVDRNLLFNILEILCQGESDFE